MGINMLGQPNWGRMQHTENIDENINIDEKYGYR
jgi:hypothetical protein